MYIIQYFRAQNALYKDFKKLTLSLWSTVYPHIPITNPIHTQIHTHSNTSASSIAVLPTISVRLAAALTVVELGMGAPTMFATA